uniref:Toll-like recptor 7 n=1 Tax=Oncomelania hupensis TaxID=56141 RepID=A0A2H4HHY0_9CAEN|nr:toll-like recptor 7 [Oncomelania hupensis]
MCSLYILLVGLLALHSVCMRDISYLYADANTIVVAVGERETDGATVSGSQGGWTFCYENLCRCKDDLADCSENGGNLTFIPKLPDPIAFVNFSFNRVERIPDNFFDNVTSVTGFDLSNNSLVHISPVAFSKLQNLRRLLITNNSGLSYATLDPVFAVRTLVDLDISFNDLGVPVPDNFFLRQPPPVWQALSLRGNDLSPLADLAVFRHFKQLQKLDLSHTGMKFKISSVMESIETLSFQHNGLNKFPETCNGTQSLIPQLSYLDLRSHSIDTVSNVVCLPSLRVLDLSEGNSFSFNFVSNAFSSRLYPNLKELYLDSMRETTLSLPAHTFNNSGLEMLSISFAQNKGILYRTFDPDTFAGCTNLQSLFLSRIYSDQLGGVDVEQLKQILQPVKDTLQKFSLSKNDFGIDDTDLEILTDLPHLTYLDLSGNYLREIPYGCFDNLLNLTELDLSSNALEGIDAPNEHTFNEATQNRLQHLDLSDNPYKCTCSYRWLYLWRQANPGLFSSNSNNYTCKGLSGDRDGIIPEHTNLILSAQACLFESENGYFNCFVITLLMFLAVFLTLYFVRKRLRVRIAMRRALGGHDRNQQQQQRRGGNVRYQYDLFVSYAEGDARWVRQFLMAELEGRKGLKLCIHQRDFHPGRHVLDNIENCVSLSRQVLMVFSPHFARSEWCQFELTLCQRHAMDRGDCLLVAYLRHVEERDMTAGMMAILRTCTYLQWSQMRRDQAYFWDHLLLALGQ